MLLISLVSIVTFSSITAHAYQACDPVKQKTMLLYIQCDTDNLQAKKLALIDKSKNDPDKYNRQHANAIAAFTELQIQNRKSIIADLKYRAITEAQAGQKLMDYMNSENVELNEFYASEQRGLESALLNYPTVNEPSYPQPTPQKDMDITCVKQRDFAGSVRCRQN